MVLEADELSEWPAERGAARQLAQMAQASFREAMLVPNTLTRKFDKPLCQFGASNRLAHCHAPGVIVAFPNPIERHCERACDVLIFICH